MIDYTINLGHIIQILVIVGGGIGALIVMRGTVAALKEDMVGVKHEISQEIKKVADLVVTLAVASKRLDGVEEDIRDMKHGRGFIMNRNGGSEYP